MKVLWLEITVITLKVTNSWKSHKNIIFLIQSALCFIYLYNLILDAWNFKKFRQYHINIYVISKWNCGRTTNMPRLVKTVLTIEKRVNRGEMGGRDSQGVWDGYVYIAIFKMDNQQGPTVQHMELCSMLYGSLDERGQERIDTCIYMAESLHCAPKPSQHY